ncbi:LacI family DNA-binding transcriptional regulator [Lichenicoccus sp.]|uniref:LacI family DNA-binding transcriptional regulator n=1 Tax=Lichenicoccus sp. TaxID=2781899 RepID=UPI003D0C627F
MAVLKPASIREVAARAGVSVATVSNAVRGRKRVTPEVAARVHEAVAALHYQADRAAAQLRSGKARVVAILVPSLENPFFTSLIAILERRAQAAGYDIIVASAGDDVGTERTRLLALFSWRPAGIVILPCSDTFPSRPILEAAHVPYVVVDRLADEPGADLIAVDNHAAAAAAAHHLLALGHRRLLVVASSLALANIRERWDGIRAQCLDAGIGAPELLEVGLTFETVSGELEQWLGRHERPTAIIALTNFTTLGVMAALRDTGLAVPGDVSLVGYDDYAWMRAASPPITAVRQPVELMGGQAWSCLMRRIEGDTAPFQSIRLAGELQLRLSTAPLRTRGNNRNHRKKT